MKRLLGVVLAGGQSRRFGSDKAFADAYGRPLLVHALQALRPFVQDVAVSGKIYPGVTSLPDRPVPDLGPLGGLCGSLHFAEHNGYSHVLTIACDTPFVSDDGLMRLSSVDGPCVVSDHPVIGLWPAHLSASLDRFLDASQNRSMRAWMTCCGAGEIQIANVANINRPSDLEAYLQAGWQDPLR